MLIEILDLSSRYWYFFLLIAFVIYLFGKKEKDILHSLRRMKESSYFRAVLVLTILSFAVYFLVVDSWPNLRILDPGTYIELVTLVFAVVAGYFAFAQLSLARYESLIEKADYCLSENQFPRALYYYERALELEKDFQAMANLAELYIIEGKLKKFEDLLEDFKSSSMGEYETIIAHYLGFLSGLAKGDRGLTEKALREMIAYCQTHPVGMRSFRSWNFDQLDISINNFSIEFQTLYNEMKEYVKGGDAKSQQIVEKYLNLRPTTPVIIEQDQNNGYPHF